MDLRTLFFRIFYISFYGLLLLFLLVLLVITPGDAIQQALQNRQIYNVFVIAGCYFLTVLIAVLIYASRLYTTRSVLAAIPKTYIPVEKDDVGHKVRKMVVESLSRSAVIAWNARPRVELPSGEANDAGNASAGEETEKEKVKKHFFSRKPKRPKSSEPQPGLTLPEHTPVWGNIAHKGWSSPTSPDLPNLEYTTVILELPHLIEAKAVSLAPEDPSYSPTLSPSSPITPQPHTHPPRSPRAMSLLQRAPTSGLREYITHLTQLNVLPHSETVSQFMLAYESARFAARPLDELQFKDLTSLFAEVLRLVLPLDMAFVDELYGAEEDYFDGESEYSSLKSTGSESLRSVLRY